MNQYQICVVVGSLRKDSNNRKLANAVIKLAPADFSFKLVQIGDLPLYNQDDDGNQDDTVKHFKDEIHASNGLLFVTPEYNRSMPGVLKNALDHGSRPYGKNSWSGKPAGIMGSSIGLIRSAAAQQHLRNVLAYLNAPTMAQPEVFLQINDGFFDATGGIADATTKKLLQGWMDSYVVWVKKLAQ